MEDDLRFWRKTLGDVGEQFVCFYLKRQGWKILGRKFHVGRSAEVDVIALNPENLTVFIEVKTRTLKSKQPQSVWFHSVTQSIDARKQKQIVRSARLYRNHTGGGYRDCRFDIFFVGLSGKLASSVVRVLREKGAEGLDEFIQERIDERIDWFGDELNIIHCEAAFIANF